MPDLPHLLTQGAGTPVTDLDLPAVENRIRQRRRQHRTGLAALALVPVLLGGAGIAGVVALQDRGEQTLLPATEVPADGDSIGLLLSVTGGDDPVLTWEPQGPCTMQRNRGEEPYCVPSSDPPPPGAQVSAPLGDLDPQADIPYPDRPPPPGTQPVDLIRGFLTYPNISRRMHITVAAGRVVNLSYSHVDEPNKMTGSVGSMDGVSYGDLLGLTELGDIGTLLEWDSLVACVPGAPVVTADLCRDPLSMPFGTLLADSPDVTLTAPGQAQGKERIRAYLDDPARGHLVEITVVDGDVVRVTDAMPVTLNPPN